MSDLRPKSTKITLGGKDYGLRFTLNAIDDIQDHFDISITNLGDLFRDGKKQIDALRYLLTALINEDIDCQNDEDSGNRKHLDERYVGRQIDAGNMNALMSSVFTAFSNGTPNRDEDDASPTTGE